jgi:large subunit ribosomal protein L5
MEKYVPNLKREYLERIVPALMQKFGYKSIMQVPRLEKIVLSRGIGEAINDKKLIETSVQEFTLISGQKAVVTKAKKDVSNFKLRKGYPIGCKVTLRGDRMYEFLDRFISLAAPKIRDFSGFDSDKFDGHGSYNIGLKDHFIFPEINPEKAPKSRGINITLVTTTKEDKTAKKLLDYFGFPFKESNKK